MKNTLAGLFLALFSSALFADELIIFKMPGCAPCAQLEKMLEENPELLQGFEVSRVDVTKNPETAKVFNVASMPTIVRLDDKTHEVARKVGVMNKREMRRWLDQHNPK